MVYIDTPNMYVQNWMHQKLVHTHTQKLSDAHTYKRDPQRKQVALAQKQSLVNQYKSRLSS